MEVKVFKINGREVEDYMLSNSDIVNLINSKDTTEDDKEFLMNKMKQRFIAILCPRIGENEDDVFARQFSDFVNGSCHSAKKVAEKMSRDHRYLQNEMFKLFMEYVKILADNYDKGFYDARNKYACYSSKKIIDCFNEENWPY